MEVPPSLFALVTRLLDELRAELDASQAKLSAVNELLGEIKGRDRYMPPPRDLDSPEIEEQASFGRDDSGGLVVTRRPVRAGSKGKEYTVRVPRETLQKLVREMAGKQSFRIEELLEGNPTQRYAVRKWLLAEGLAKRRMGGSVVLTHLFQDVVDRLDQLEVA